MCYNQKSIKMNQVTKKRFIQGAVASAILALSLPAMALKWYAAANDD